MSATDLSYIQRIASAVELLQGKWTVEILSALREGPVRLSKLKREIPRASKKAITARLRLLEAAHVIERRDLSGSVLHVEYSLTDVGQKSLIGLLNCLAEVGAFHASTRSQ